MATARNLIVDDTSRGVYHCLSRCVRRAHLCGDGLDHRREWIRERLRLLNDIFAIDVAAYAVMSNHLHVILETHPDRVAAWTDEEIARRWLRLYPGRRDDVGVEPTRERIEALLEQPKRMNDARQGLSSLSIFMKNLKEPLARMANKEDDVTGHFWEGRFDSHKVLDLPGLLRSMSYVDLNPIRAGVAATPERSDYTSIQDRIHVRQQYQKSKGLRRRAPVRAATLLTHDRASGTLTHAEDGIWLASIDHLLGCSVDEYISLVDAIGRLARDGAGGRIPEHLAPILDRLKFTESHLSQVANGIKRWIGTVTGEEVARIEEAARRKIRRVVDVFGANRRRA